MSKKYISPAEREYIAQTWGNYASVAEISAHLGKSRKTIYAELRRGQDGERLDENQRLAYAPELAQRRFQDNPPTQRQDPAGRHLTRETEKEI